MSWARVFFLSASNHSIILCIIQNYIAMCLYCITHPLYQPIHFACLCPISYQPTLEFGISEAISKIVSFLEIYPLYNVCYTVVTIMRAVNIYIVYITWCIMIPFQLFRSLTRSNLLMKKMSSLFLSLRFYTP